MCENHCNVIKERSRERYYWKMVRNLPNDIPLVLTDTRYVYSRNGYHTVCILESWPLISGAGDLGTFPYPVYFCWWCVNSTDASVEFLRKRDEWIPPLDMELLLLLFPYWTPPSPLLVVLPCILMRRWSNKLADTTLCLRTFRKDHIPSSRHINCIRNCEDEKKE